MNTEQERERTVVATQAAHMLFGEHGRPDQVNPGLLTYLVNIEHYKQQVNGTPLSEDTVALAIATWKMVHPVAPVYKIDYEAERERYRHGYH